MRVFQQSSTVLQYVKILWIQTYSSFRHIFADEGLSKYAYHILYTMAMPFKSFTESQALHKNIQASEVKWQTAYLFCSQMNRKDLKMKFKKWQVINFVSANMNLKIA